MVQPGRLSLRSRWVASTGVLVVAGAVLAGTVMASAAAPSLPKLTPAQLLVNMRHATLPSAMTAVITENANLGFPALPDIPGLSSSTLSAASLITGTHTVDVWYAGPEHVRIALPVSFGETDLRVNGHQIWLWDSHSQTATHYILPATFPATFRPLPAPMIACAGRHQMPVSGMVICAGRIRALAPVIVCLRGLRMPVSRAVLLPGTHPAPAQVPLPLRKAMLRAHGVPLRLIMLCARGHGMKRFMLVPPLGISGPVSGKPAPASGKPVPATGSQGTASVPPVAEMTPLQAAERLLAMVGPTTQVTVPGTVTVAGHAAYQLSIAPRSSSSLIGQIVIAVDAKTYLPLQVQVFARGSSSPAFQIGFTSLIIGQPARSNFTFTPPPGAMVKTVRLPSTLPGFTGLGLPFGGLPFGPGGMVVRGSAGAIVVSPPGGISVPSSRVQLKIMKLRRHLVNLRIKAMAGRPAVSRQIITVPASNGGAFSGAGPRVLGSGWLSVLVIPAGPVLAAVTPGSEWRAAASPGPQGLTENAAYQSSVAFRPGPPGQIVALLRTLLNAATRVHGSWGSGRLLTTSLFSVLLTSKGDVLIGAVTPSVLYADAAKVK